MLYIWFIYICSHKVSYSHWMPEMTIIRKYFHFFWDCLLNFTEIVSFFILSYITGVGFTYFILIQVAS